MADYGIDFAGVDDLTYALATVTGPRVVAEAVARELTTPYGSLFYDREYGNDVRRYLNAPVVDVGIIAHSVEATALRDERVRDAEAEVLYENEQLTIKVRLLLGDGPFEMVLTVDKLTVELLTAAAR